MLFTPSSRMYVIKKQKRKKHDELREISSETGHPNQNDDPASSGTLLTLAKGHFGGGKIQIFAKKKFTF